MSEYFGGSSLYRGPLDIASLYDGGAAGRIGGTRSSAPSLRGVRGESGTLRSAKLSCWSLLHLFGERGARLEESSVPTPVLLFPMLLKAPRLPKQCW